MCVVYTAVLYIIFRIISKFSVASVSALQIVKILLKEAFSIYFRKGLIIMNYKIALAVRYVYSLHVYTLYNVYSTGEICVNMINSHVGFQ